MRHYFLKAIVIGFACSATLRGQSQSPLEVLKSGKAATALIEAVDGDTTTATAFCIDPSGLFVTNSHVVSAGSQFRLVVNSGTVSQAIYSAKLVRNDPKLDLALVQAEGATGLKALALGNEDALIETMEVIAFGYPFGKSKTIAKGEPSPSISVNTGKITSLRMPSGKLTSIQLDVVLNPGNSGGPVIDKEGRVIGIVQGGLVGAQVNFAIPVGRLNELLRTPIVLLMAPALSLKTLGTPGDWSIRITPATQLDNLKVNLILEQGPGDRRIYEALPSGKGDGVFVAHVERAGIAPSTKTVDVIANASFASGQIEGRVADRSIIVGDKTYWLKNLQAIRFAEQPAIVLSDGSEVMGEAKGLESVLVDLGGASISVDLRKSIRIELHALPVGTTTLKATVNVKRSNVELASTERVFEFSEADATSGATIAGGSGSLSIIHPTAMTRDREEIRLPGPVTDIAVGAGGRILLLSIKSLKKLAILDVNSAKVVRLMSLPSDDSLVTAGAEKFLIISPATSVIDRWDLATLERERRVPVPLAGNIVSVAMGSRSSGPVLAFVNLEENNNSTSGRFVFFDPISFRLLSGFRQDNYFMKNRQNVAPQIEKAGMVYTPHFGQAEQRVQLRAAPNGEMFTAWSTQHSPAGFLTFVWKTKKTLEFRYDHTDVQYNVPGPDGLTLFTGSAGIINEEQKPTLRSLPQERRYLPSTAPGYFLGFEGTRASLYAAGNSSPLILIDDLKELGTTDAAHRQPYNTRDIIWDKRVQFIAEANLLVTIPPEVGQITLRRVNALDLLKKSSVDYLFVESIPPRATTKGAKFDYQIRARSRRGGLKYELSSAPEGMTISQEGRLRWNVPTEIEEEEVTPIITIKDNSGAEIFHTFSMRVR
jgi:serine protease Do